MLHLTKKTRAAVVLITSALIAAPALAHPGAAGHVHGFAEGFAHPFSGLDHLLAMIAVGLWAAQNKRSATWILPLVFPLMMVAGALAGMSGWQVSGVETGISSSVAVSGLLIAFAVRLPVWASAAVVSLFAVFHGYAHGVELPQDSSPLLYGSGFVLATFLLHMIGLVVGLFAGRNAASKIVRLIGAGIAAVGLCMLGGFA
jgi:urease accessory protein